MTESRISHCVNNLLICALIVTVWRKFQCSSVYSKKKYFVRLIWYTISHALMLHNTYESTIRCQDICQMLSNLIAIICKYVIYEDIEFVFIFLFYLIYNTNGWRKLNKISIINSKVLLMQCTYRNEVQFYLKCLYVYYFFLHLNTQRRNVFAFSEKYWMILSSTYL